MAAILKVFAITGCGIGGAGGDGPNA